MKRIFWLALAFAPWAWAGEVQVVLNGCEAGQSVRVGLYLPAANFPKGKADYEQVTQASGATATVLFADVPAGRYAVAAYLDSNGNQQLDRHWYGPPSERYGFSNNARNAFSAPSFEQAAFDVGASRVVQTIQLQ